MTFRAVGSPFDSFNTVFLFFPRLIQVKWSVLWLLSPWESRPPR